MSFAFLATSLIVVAIPGMGVVYTVSVMPGRETTFSISRIALAFMSAVRAASSSSRSATTRPS